MFRLKADPFFVFALAALIALTTTGTSRAQSMSRPVAAGTPYDLINAVNALRVSYGLAPYSISPILMFTAQSQAEFMATTGNVSHNGPGGLSLTERLLAADYPLAGDLSLGGFRAENITSGNEDRSAQSAVDGWTGDALHLDTMISPNLSEIGAGVAIAEGRVYYVIDAALPTSSGVIPDESTSIAGSDSTALPAEVQVSDPTAMPMPIVTVAPAATSASLETPVSGASTPSAVAATMPVDNKSIASVAIGIIVLTLLGGGVFTWLGSKKRE